MFALSSTEASSVPRQIGTPADRSRRNGMMPLPIFWLLTGLWATVQPEAARSSMSSSSTQMAWITIIRGVRTPASWT